MAISKLTFGIEDVSKQIRNLVRLRHLCSHTRLIHLQVIAHHEDLLTQASNANSLSGTLSSVRSGLNDLDASVDKYALRIVVTLHPLSLLKL